MCIDGTLDVARSKRDTGHLGTYCDGKSNKQLFL